MGMRSSRGGIRGKCLEAAVVVPRENFLTGFPLIKKQQNEYCSGGWGQEINRLIGFRRPLNSPLKRVLHPESSADIASVETKNCQTGDPRPNQPNLLLRAMVRLP